MLDADQIDRISTLWLPDDWPDFADKAYAAACHRASFAYYVERIRHLGLSGETVIDAGCGTGRWSFPLATVFERVMGFDSDPGRIATANWLKDRFDAMSVQFSRGDVRRMPAEDGDTDAIYCNSVALGAIVGAKTILAESFRALKPGGVCYIGLNGPGYSYEMASLADSLRADQGRKRIYSSLCQRFLAPIAADIGPGGSLNARVRAGVARGLPAASLLPDLGAGGRLRMAAAAIESELDAAFAETLANDLAGIAEGRQSNFSYWEAGRDYVPEELCSAALEVGFDRFEWALDGYLSLRPGGAVSRGPSAKAPPNNPTFEGRVRIFEALAWKPGSTRN